jgi:hypothetical protein
MMSIRDIPTRSIGRPPIVALKARTYIKYWKLVLAIPEARQPRGA